MKIENEQVLFVCEGNVGRSQMTEGFWKHWFGEDSAKSAGINDYREKYNFHPREDIIQAMFEKGIDISEQKIKVLVQEMLRDITTIIVLCDPSILPDFIVSSGLNILYKGVPDPYESSMDGVRQVRDEIELLLSEIAGREVPT